MIDINKLSKKYTVRKLEAKDSLILLELQRSNPFYFEHCPPEPSIESILSDMTALPPGKDLTDLYYVGFFEEEYLVAVLHFLISYPKKETIFIGLFMVNRDFSGNGIGSKIIKDVLDYFKLEGFRTVRLGYMKENPQAKAFWKKCAFIDIGIETENAHGKVVLLEKNLG